MPFSIFWPKTPKRQGTPLGTRPPLGAHHMAGSENDQAKRPPFRTFFCFAFLSPRAFGVSRPYKGLAEVSRPYKSFRSWAEPSSGFRIPSPEPRPGTAKSSKKTATKVFPPNGLGLFAPKTADPSPGVFGTNQTQRPFRGPAFGSKTGLPPRNRLSGPFEGLPKTPLRLISSKKAGGWSDPDPAALGLCFSPHATLGFPVDSADL